jgi:hypothetical protein
MIPHLECKRRLLNVELLSHSEPKSRAVQLSLAFDCPYTSPVCVGLPSLSSSEQGEKKFPGFSRLRALKGIVAKRLTYRTTNH